MTKEKVLAWLDKQIGINKEIEATKCEGLERLDVYRYDEIHIHDALRTGETIGITTIIDEFNTDRNQYIGYFFYKDIKFFSLYEESQIKEMNNENT